MSIQPTSSVGGMPPKARLPMGPSSMERTSSQKAGTRTLKSRSRERKATIRGLEGSGSKLRSSNQDLHFSQQTEVAGDGNNNNYSNGMMIGSGLSKHRSGSRGLGGSAMTGGKEQNSQTQLQIPNQRPIYRLLQGFKLQQYSKTFIEHGFGDDIYKLTLLTQRKRQELIDSSSMMPGHKQRMVDLFKRIDNFYPRSNVQKTIELAQKTCSTRQSQSRLSQHNNESLSIQASAEKANVSRDSVQTAVSSNVDGTLNAANSIQSGPHGQSLLQTQQVHMPDASTQAHQSQIPPPTQFVKRSGISPPSQGRQKRGNNGGPSTATSLVRRFNGLDPGTRQAINDSFLTNIKSGKGQVTVSEALKEFYGKDPSVKQKALNKIFPNQGGSKVKPHYLLASGQNQVSQSASGTGGFGLQKFVKVQKGSKVIENYRSQVSPQTQSKQKPAGQNLPKTESQPSRRQIGVKGKNSNSSSDSKSISNIYLNMKRKGSHQAARKRNTSTSSERKEHASSAFAKLPTGRQQLQTQSRQQRVTSQNRAQMNQNSNFMMAPNSSRGDYNKANGKAAQNGAPQTQGGRTRLHRVRSATGYKDVHQQQQQQQPSQSNTLTNQSNDYLSQSGAHSRQQQKATVTVGQQAAMKRIQLHRQKSATKRQMPLESSLNTQSTTNKSRLSKPPTSTSTSQVPQFIQQPSQMSNPLNSTANTSGNARRQISRDRAGQLDVNGQVAVGNPNGPGPASSQEYSRLRLLKRASSQGASSRDLPQQNSRRSRDSRQLALSSQGAVGVNSVCEPVSQSEGFTEFKMIKSPQSQTEMQEEIRLPAITSTMKKANQKAENLDNSMKSTNAVHPAAVTAGKPPMSTSKRSAYSSKAESLKTVESVHSSPGKKLTSASPRRPLILEPIQNPPIQQENKTDIQTSSSKIINFQDGCDGSQQQKLQVQEPPKDEEPSVEEKVNREAINIKWTPLLDKSEKVEARDHGYSFGSKKVAMGPGFMNLRFMCHCLARAIKRHLEFSQGDHWFLQDLQKDEDDVDLEFSYQLPQNLKLTLNPSGIRVSDEDDEDDPNPFQREDGSPVRDIETMDIEVDTMAGKAKNQSSGAKPTSPGIGGEPEPETIKSSDDEGGNSKFQQQQRPNQFSNSHMQETETSDKKGSQVFEQATEDEIGEELDEQDYENDFAVDPEEESIKAMRREQMRNSVLKKDQERLNEYMNQRKVTELEQKLKSKDKQIKQLTRLVQHTGGVRQEVMAISAPTTDQQPCEQDDDEGFFDRGVKMDRAEWLMAQVDLDPIESHGSMEMNSTKFKSLHGKRFINSEGGNGVEDSRTSRSTKPPAPIKEQQPKKKSQKSYESAFVDVSEDKMREFALSQLRYFDVRMEYDNEIFNEDQFIPMPSEKYIADYCKYVTISCKMENEIPIVCLVYLEKLLLTTGILLNKWNWRRLVLICLCLASKIWDDDSLENVHFPKVMSDVTNYEINKLEQLFLEFIDYKLVIKGGEYAKYYFILRSMADEINDGKKAKVPELSPFENARRNKQNKEEWAEFPLCAPISAGKMLELQNQEAKAEVYLKERHEREFLRAYIGHKAGSRKDATRHPSLLLDRTM